MKKSLFFVFTALFLSLYISSLGETSIFMDSSACFIEQDALFTVQSDKECFRYFVTKDGEHLFTSPETSERKGAYVPREAGNYTISVEARNSDEQSCETASVVFSVSGKIDMTLSVDHDRIALGSSVGISADCDLDSESISFIFSVFRDNMKLWQQKSTDSACIYHPKHIGIYEIRCLLLHESGQSCEASVSFEVVPGSGIALEGESAVFDFFGGQKEFTVHADGIWTAECNDSRFLLDKAAGRDGDFLTVCAVPDESLPAHGVLTIKTAGSTADFILSITDHDSVEEELLPEEQTLPPWERVLVIMDQGNTYTAEISSDGPWTCTADRDDIDISTDGSLLTCRLPSNKTDHILYSHIRISDGTNDGHLAIYQIPERDKPEIIAPATLDICPEYTAFSDVISLNLVCSPDTAALLVDTDWGLHLELDRSAAMYAENFWQITFPAESEGIKRIMITPINAEGTRGDGKWADIRVLPEEPAVIRAEAVHAGDGTRLRLLTTASTDEITLSDAQNNVFRFTRDNAEIDLYIDENNHERYALWEIIADGDTPYISCGVSDTVAPIIHTAITKEETSSDTELLPYDQFNGLWIDVPYRTSELQTSGCAIFTLATALSKLGYSGEEIEPGKLADKYRFCLVKGGTLNSTLIGNAGKEFNYRTRYDLYTEKSKVMQFFSDGAVFSFSVVQGHIALIDRPNEDGTYFHVMDSALTATFSRIKGAGIFVLKDGQYQPVSSPGEIDNARYYIETDAYSGGQYWLKAEYCLKRGMRLILPKTE